MGKLKPITIVEVKKIAHFFAKKHLEWDEPIPLFKTRAPNILESSLAIPFQRFSNKDLYQGLLEKSAILFYLMIKNHPFQNGNKRIAITTLLVFLAKNGKWIKVNNKDIYKFAKWIANSNSESKDGAVQAIKDFLKKNIVDF